jgi:hypothetical protein
MPDPVKMTLVGKDGNAFSLMGAFQSEARKQGWTKEEIQKVLDECMKGDYDHLLRTLMDNIDDTSEIDTDNEFEFNNDEEQ